MNQVELTAGAIDEGALRHTPRFRVFRRLSRRPVAIAAIVIIAIIYAAGLLAPLIAPYEFDDTDLRNTFAGPSADHWLGTDRLGRDVFSRLIWSAQTTVIFSVFTVVSGSLILGVSLGLMSGYFAGRVDNVIMRVADALYSVPTLLLLLIINVTMEDRVDAWFRDIEDFTGIGGLARSGVPELFLLSLALSIFGWVGMARLVRSQVLSLRETNYVLAAKAIGSSTSADPLSPPASSTDEFDGRDGHALIGGCGTSGGYAHLSRHRRRRPRELRYHDLPVRWTNKCTRAPAANLCARAGGRAADALLQPSRRRADGRSLASAEVTVGRVLTSGRRRSRKSRPIGVSSQAVRLWSESCATTSQPMSKASCGATQAAGAPASSRGRLMGSGRRSLPSTRTRRAAGPGRASWTPQRRSCGGAA